MYATTAQFDDAYGSTERLDLEAGNPARSVQALSHASAEADSYAAVRYGTPLQSPGPQLVQCVLDIARFRLYDDRAPEEVRTRYQDAVQWLRDIAAGRAVLLSATGAPGTNGTGTPTASVSIAAGSATQTGIFGPAFTARYTTDLPRYSVTAWERSGS